MTTSTWTITCSGRPVDARNQPSGDPCGKTYARPNHLGGLEISPVWALVPMPDAEYLARARAGGWKVHVEAGRVTAMCPSCGRPDRALAALARELHQSVLQQGTFDVP